MVIIPILPQEEFGPNDHRKDALTLVRNEICSPVEVAAATVAHNIPNAAKIRRFLASASPIFCFWIRIVLIYENYSASCR